MLESLDLKADIQVVNECLETKANKASVAQAIQKRVFLFYLMFYTEVCIVQKEGSGIKI